MEHIGFHPFATARNHKGALQLCAVATLLIVPGTYLLVHGQYSLLLSLIFTGMLLAIWLLQKTAAVLLSFTFLFLLGDLRRLVSFFVGAPGLDPLLLVGTAFAFLLAVPLLLRVRLQEALSKSVFGLTVIMVLEVINPRQGSLALGLSGALFFLTPLFWFWIGRRYATEPMMTSLLYRVVIPLGTAAALLGVYQTYVGLLPWEAYWAQNAVRSGYNALFLGGGHIRSFGFSVNSAEYGNLLLIAEVCVLGAIFAGQRVYGLLLPLLLLAQLLASQRGAILKLLLAAVVLWAVRSGNVRVWLPRILLGLPLMLGLLYYSVSKVGNAPPPQKKASTASFATSHVTQGLAHPLDARYSTAGLHTEMFFNGLLRGFTNPVGDGLGVVTLGVNKFGGTSALAGSSEVDLSDVFTTCGVFGGGCYLVVIFAGLRRAGTYIRVGPRQVSYPVLALLVSMLTAWIALGEYAVGPLVWFCLGFLAKQMPLLASQRVQASLGRTPLFCRVRSLPSRLETAR